MPSVSLNLLVLRTRHLEALRAFYETIGIEFAEEQHGKGPRHCAGRIGDLVFELYPLADDAPAAESTRLGFAVQDLEATFAALQSTGVSLVSPPKMTPWGMRAVVRDPDGRVVELSQR